MAEAAIMRTLRLATGDLRGSAMQLFGHLEQLIPDRSEPSHEMAGVIGMTRALLDLADDMQDHALPSLGSRVILAETVKLEPLLTEQIAAVTAILGPSRRHWRVGAEASCTLLADSRALSHVINRVLGNAARESRHGDWIDINLRHDQDGAVLTIEHEGCGRMAQHHDIPVGQPDTRGIRFGMALARILMEAHGGSLNIEPGAKSGTRVRLRFPAERVARDVANITQVDFAAA